jgi:hypothetical protein
VHTTGTFCFAAQNGHQSLKEKNIVRPSQVKLLVGFQPNFTGVISAIPKVVYTTGTFHFAAKIAARAKNTKILSGFQRSNYWLDFNLAL